MLYGNETGVDCGRATVRCDGGAHPSTRDRGFTVTEIVITVVLLGIVVAAVLNSVMTGIRASSTSRDAARVETAIVNAADRINRAPNTKCDYSIYARASVMTEWGPSAANLATVTHQRWEPGASVTDPGTWVGWDPAHACPSGSEPPSGIVRRVTVTVTTPSGSITRSIEVVKSDV